MKRAGFTLVELLIFLACCALIVVAVIVLVHKSDPNETEVASRADVLPGKVSIVCIEGHEYLYTESGTSSFTRAAMAPKFDDEGRPSKCRSER